MRRGQSTEVGNEPPFFGQGSCQRLFRWHKDSAWDCCSVKSQLRYLFNAAGIGSEAES